MLLCSPYFLISVSKVLLVLNLLLMVPVTFVHDGLFSCVLSLWLNYYLLWISRKLVSLYWEWFALKRICIWFYHWPETTLAFLQDPWLPVIPSSPTLLVSQYPNPHANITATPFSHVDIQVSAQGFLVALLCLLEFFLLYPVSLGMQHTHTHTHT